MVDPIIESTTKTILLKKSAIKHYKKMIIPLATIITPNRHEAKILAGTPSIEKAAKEIQKLGAKNVIITGYNETKNIIEDFVLESKKDYILKGKKIEIIFGDYNEFFRISACLDIKTLRSRRKRRWNDIKEIRRYTLCRIKFRK